VVVLADEIHAPLVLPGRTHHPLVSVSPEAAGHGIVVTSASKAWNLAGLKAAVIVTADPTTRRLVQRLPEELPWRVGRLGVLGSIAKGRVALSSGPSFGRPGIGHVRLNLGISRQLLAEAVDRMASAIGR
jgi:cystathionine beta-lyase